MSKIILHDSPNEGQRQVFHVSIKLSDLKKVVQAGKQAIAQRANVPVAVIDAEIAWQFSPCHVLSRWYVSWQGVIVTLNGEGEVLECCDAWMEVER